MCSDFMERFTTRSTCQHVKNLHIRWRNVSELCLKKPQEVTNGGILLTFFISRKINNTSSVPVMKLNEKKIKILAWLVFFSKPKYSQTKATVILSLG